MLGLATTDGGGTTGGAPYSEETGAEEEHPLAPYDVCEAAEEEEQAPV